MANPREAEVEQDGDGGGEGGDRGRCSVVNRRCAVRPGPARPGPTMVIKDALFIYIGNRCILLNPGGWSRNPQDIDSYKQNNKRQYSCFKKF